MEKNISFTADSYEIQGLFYKGSKKGVVITHPHPLYGGDMNNYIVETIQSAYKNKNYSTLRFNFRGVEKSQGSHDEGKGEQNDVLGAIEYLKQQGCDSITISGYSFGTWVNTMVVYNNSLTHEMTMISPPVAFMDFNPIKPIPNLKLVIAGSHDEIGPPNQIESIINKWNPDAVFKIIKNGDHFYSNQINPLEMILDDYI